METPVVPDNDITSEERENRMNVFQIPEIDDDLVNPTFQEFTDIKQRAIRKFMVSYDTSYLKRTHFTQGELNLLKEKLWKNKVLIKLINNFLVDTNERNYRRKYIEGPISLSIYQSQIATGQPVGNLYMTVYIFGEMHRNTNGYCYQRLSRQLFDGNIPWEQRSREILDYQNYYIRFRDFLRYLALETPSFFDFFIETSLDRRDDNTNLTIFGNNWGIDYFNLYLCFQEMAYWIIRHYPTAFDYAGTRQIDLNLINANLPAGVSAFPDLNSFVATIDTERIDNNPNNNNISHNYITYAKRILLQIGGRLHFPLPTSTEWRDYVVPQLFLIRSTPVSTTRHGLEMLQMKTDFKECFKPEQRKLTTVGSYGLSNIDKCRLGRFHDIDARKIGRENANLNAIQLGYGIILKYFMYRNADDYDMRNPIFLPGLIDVYNNVNIRYFINMIQERRHEDDYHLDISVEIPTLSDRDIGIAYAIITFCFGLFPELNRARESCPENYRNEIIAFIITKIMDNHSIVLQPQLGRPLIPLRNVLDNILTVLDRQTNAVINNDDTALLYLIMLSAHFFMINVFVMDLYCLFRLFKQYKTKTDCHPNRNYNVIIYAGDAHSNCYREFINYHREKQFELLQRKLQAGEITQAQFQTLEEAIFTEVYHERNQREDSCVSLDEARVTHHRDLGIYQYHEHYSEDEDSSLLETDLDTGSETD